MLDGKTIKNKQVKREEVENKVVLLDFFFPDYSITIQATSKEEAEEKLKSVLIELNNK